MGFFDGVRDSLQKKAREMDKRQADYIRRNSDKISDEALFVNYAHDCENGNEFNQRRRDAMRRELERRGYDPD